MGSRTDFQALLETVIGSDAVYFQPPPNISMSYPCIVYEHSDNETIFANNVPYNIEKQYSLTVIYKDPDSSLPDDIAKLPLCNFNRHFAINNLNHDVFDIFF